MLIRIGFELIFDLPAAAPMVLLLSTHPERDYTIRRLGRAPRRALGPHVHCSPTRSATAPCGWSPRRAGSGSGTT